MMGKIRQLDETLSNMIAAGEVVENMASVIKELMENAIDANADKITIDLNESGFKKIRVEDNGDGMDKEDLTMAFKRHATSKIKTAHDLHHIASLGFRGEALPSIASVSKVVIDTSTTDDVGHQITLKNGQVESLNQGHAKKGTTVTVYDLFYNTPGRLKHLKSPEKELSYIVDICNRMALSHAHIAFTLRNNQKTLLKTTGDGEVLKVLYQLYPISVIKEMLYFEGKNNYFKISGYLSKPHVTRSTNQHMMFFTNHRSIRNNRLNQAVIKGMDTYLPMHKYPIIYCHISVDPLLIDVNIHPQKLTIKFSEQRLLEQLIEHTIKAKLSETNLIPEIEKNPKKPKENIQFDFTSTPEEQKTSEPPKIEEATAQKPQSTSLLPHMEYVGQAMGTYLIFQGENALYLMDQHAAAERIRYETYKNKLSLSTVENQTLTTPFIINLSTTEMHQFNALSPILKSLGLSVEKRDDKRLNVTQIPTWFYTGYEEIYTESLIKQILEENPADKKSILDPLAKELACKHSIRGNQYINRDEVDRLFKDLSHTNNPYTCPHGRPTIIKFSQTELETLFKRIQS